MPNVRFVPMPTEHAERYWNGGLDAHAMLPERHVSNGVGVPCRHCLTDVVRGEPYLTLAYRPFPEPQPYAEVGPVFLHAKPCPAYADNEKVPGMYVNYEDRLLRGYTSDNRIAYGTGKIAQPHNIATEAARILDDPDIAYVHVRSSTNNCYACRIERA